MYDPAVICTEAVSPGVPTRAIRHVVPFLLNVRDCTEAAETVTAEGSKGTTGFVKVARTVKVELANEGCCCTVNVA